MRRFNLMLWMIVAGIILAGRNIYIYKNALETRAYYAWSGICAVLVILLAAWLLRNRYLFLSMKQVDRLDGVRFEKYLAAHFRQLGYKVSFTENSHDYGADLIITKFHKTTVVQAKRYEKNVGLSAVQEAVASRSYYDADAALVVTNSYFTSGAISLAERNDVGLWDRDLMKKKFHI